MSPTRVYVSCSQSREIQVFSLDGTSGRLSLLQSCATPGKPFPLWVSPDQSTLYAGLREEDRMAALAIDADDGHLRLLGHVAAAGAATYISCDASRRTLFCASVNGSNLSVSQLDERGVPQPMSQVESDLPKAHAARTDATNRWLLVPMFGADAICVYRLNEDGRIAPHTSPMVRTRAGSAPRHLVFSPDNRHVHCLNELDCSIDLFDFDADAGTLAFKQSIGILPPGFSGKPWASELRMTADGCFLFSTERTSSAITAFAVDAASGHMSLIDHFPTESVPRGMGVDPSGRWLVAAGQTSAHLTVYAIDQACGRLQPVARHACGQEPICVEISG